VLKFIPTHQTAWGGDDVQVICTECHGKAVIQSRAVKDPKVSDLYCSCKNPRCGHTFVMTLSYSHTLSPSSKQASSMVLDLLRGMPKAEQLQLLQQATH